MKKQFLAAAAFAASLVAPSVAQAAPANVFLRDAIRSDNSEIDAGRLAQRRGASPAVRQYGASLVRDHGMSRTQAMNVARRLGVRAPNGLKPDAIAMRQRLMRLSGRAFDVEFARGMAAAHREAIAKFEDQARTGEPLTRRHARRTLPHLRHHLEMAERIAR